MALPRARVCALVCATALGAQRPLNLLFYGNSYSADHATVPAMVGVLAQTAGEPAPRIVARLVGGSDLRFHQTDPAQVAAIADSLPEDEEWDFVVLQGLSTEAAAATGDPAAFRAAAVGIVANVRAHSPRARAVLYQTWARARGHAWYPTVFPSPMAMHEEVRANYRRAADDIDRAFGPGTARLARVGDAVANLAFDPQLYTADLSHPARAITLVAGMAVYGALWHAPLWPLAPVFTQQTPIGRHFLGNGFPPALWAALHGHADLVRDRALRPFPGSEEDLLLLTGTASAYGPTPHATVPCGSILALAVVSPNAGYRDAAAALLLGPSGARSHPAFPELFVGHAGMLILGAQRALGDGLAMALPIPHATGSSFIVQGVALAPSLRRPNPRFTATDALEVLIR